MNIKSIVKNFLYNRDCILVLTNDGVYMHYYEKIILVEDKRVKVKCDNSAFVIVGENLKIKKLTEDELYIYGNIKSIERLNE